MALNIVLLVLVSAAIHPFWNLLVKKNPDPQLGFMCLTGVMALCGLVHGIFTGTDFATVLDVWPLVGLSICGLLLYGICLTATLRRGDLSTYYPIIRASPVFIVVVSVLFLGESYTSAILVGIAMAVAGGFLLLYRRGTHFLDDPATLGFALLAMVGTGIYSLADAQLMQTISPQAQVFAVDGVVFPIYVFLWLRQRASKPSTKLDMSGLSLIYLAIPGVLAYTSYYLILLAYQFGGDVAAVTSIRQASIPISVALGGYFLREGRVVQRLFAAGLLACGIIVIALNG